MKFTCDKCGAQYMISDEKVGPSGVKVRCKKCSNVILVRRVTNGAAGAARPGGGEKALDAELGQAFDHAFGDGPAAAGAAAKDARKGAGKDLAATQMMGEEDAAKITASAATAAAAAPAPSATEWYVAIGQAQVGPLPVGEVKKKWEAGDVGPDSLVWRPGMGDWKPLSAVSDLAAYLAPVPRPAPAPAREAPRAEAKADGAAAAAPEATWKPVGASALAALASEEIAARKSPEPRPQSRPAPSGAKSLMDALPDGGGVDPTGAIPLSIKALETTGEKKIERRSSSVARGVAEARHRRGVTRAVVLTLVTALLVVGAVAGGLVWYMNEKLAKVPLAAAPPPPAAAPAPAPPPRPAVAVAPPAPAAQPAPPPRAPEPPKAAPEPEPRRAAPEPKIARNEPLPKTPPRTPLPRPEPKVARAEPPPPPEPPPAPPKKKGDLLDFEGNDSALDEALGNKPSGRSVYVPPARAGGSTDLPNQLSPGDINAAVAQRIDPLRKCVSDQKARDPNATGVLRMRWIIGGDGNVRDVKPLPGDYAQSPFAQCIAGVVRSIKFPRSRTTGQEVTFPFNF